ncbi:Crp/Fnr family transcriptional regulator [Myroides sp. N17-2]|uniref:Crp/Fnr family transcriptional regulator n=1 Tax=Myroides sp. N17-2 TaxID=2030799 RepID=UPI000EFD26E4|nr:Crp/Fnr family transcriptional regulator [Myroides sp. N17-2]
MSESFQEYNQLFKVEQPYFEHFFSLLEKRMYKKGQLLLEEGERCEYIGFIQKGTLRMYITNEEGQEVNYVFFFDGNCVTDYEGILNDKKTILNIQALETTDIFLLHKDDLFRLYQSDAYWMDYRLKMVEGLYLKSRQRIVDLLYNSPEKRYVNLMEENPLIFEKISHKHIASYLGITKESLSRIKKRISES